MSARRSRASRTFRTAVAVALGGLLAVLLPTAGATAAPAPVATRIVVTSLGTDGVTVPDTGGAPDAYIVKGARFTMSLCFVGPGAGVTDYTHSGTPVTCTAANGALPLSYNKDVVLSLTTTGLHAGSWNVTVPKGTSQAAFSGTFTAAVNDTSIDISNDARKADELVTGSTGGFDVLIASATAQASGLTGIGGGGGKDTACTATPEEQVCADLLLPTGVATGVGLLSLGVCDALCSSQLVQVLIGLSGGINANPATLIVKCDKTLCGGGAIRDVPLYVTLGADESPGAAAPACPSKGTVGSDQKFCVDYVQSTRDNAGDTILYLLFMQDAKVRFS
jgi:hypothetical protein